MSSSSSILQIYLLFDGLAVFKNAYFVSSFMIENQTVFTSRTERIITDWSERAEINLYVKRDDLVHPTIIGNKWRKLKYNLIEARQQSKKTLFTFGGAFSNHIYATAAAAKAFGFESVGIIRGDELNVNSNPTLQFAYKNGMVLKFVSRSDFRIYKNQPALMGIDLSDYYVLPEGGTNELAIKGCAELVEEIDLDFDFLITSIGTGGTMAGLIKGAKGKGEIIGISSLKGNFIQKNIEDLLTQNSISWKNYRTVNNYHFGGYGVVNKELINFINKTNNDVGLRLDPIYTAKSFFGVRAMVNENLFPKGSKVVFLHTGGLQGIDGFNQKHEEKIDI
ncbi:MAG: 1-aminocyclopropane-1-carboxylate deaminase [Cyclobacteriaceae bacterium]|jgi:1-aminocyclopropane-1-carboxylate deaminase